MKRALLLTTLGLLVALAGCGSNVATGSTTSTGAGGAAMACTKASDCPTTDNVCNVPACTAGQCATVPAAQGTPCDGDGAGFGSCNGQGDCYGCLSDADCAPSTGCTHYFCDVQQCAGEGVADCVECSTDADCASVPSDAGVATCVNGACQ
jgi:hypothetical protein